MFACWHCGKAIHGKCVHYIPASVYIKLGVDFPKAFHPRCKKAYDRAAMLPVKP